MMTHIASGAARPNCTAATKQKALYLQYGFSPTLTESPATDLSVQVEWNSTSDMRRWGRNGIFAAHPIGTSDGVGGYFGSQADGNPSQGGLIFSVWDKLDEQMPERNVSACQAHGLNKTWCSSLHAFALSPGCRRHCLDCGLHPGWKNTTGVQCSVPMRLNESDALRFRLHRTAAVATFSEPSQGLGLSYQGSEWSLEASRVGADGAVEGSPVIVGRMFWQGTFGGIDRLGAFHEHIGCTPCEAFYESELRTGPWIEAPQRRTVRRIGFAPPHVASCRLFDVEITTSAQGTPCAQFRTGPGAVPAPPLSPPPPPNSIHPHGRYRFR